MPTTPQTAENDSHLVHRERLSRRYHDQANHPWVAIAIGTIVVVGAIVWIALGM